MDLVVDDKQFRNPDKPSLWKLCLRSIGVLLACEICLKQNNLVRCLIIRK